MMNQPRATWMANRIVQDKLFQDIVIPGTHDSTTSQLTLELSTISYRNIQFLWNLVGDSAPVNGKFPWESTLDAKPIYIGPTAYNWVMSLIKSTGKSQGETIYEQLVGGVRYFDLRIYYDKNKDGVYLQHALRGPSFDSIIKDVAKFIKDYPEGKELVFLELSHANFSKMANVQASGQQMVVDSINKHLGNDEVYTFDVIDFNALFDLDAELSEKALSEITGSGTKVILLNTDTDYYYPSQVLTSTGFKSSGRFHKFSDGVNNLKDLIEGEQGPLRENNGAKRKLYAITWTFTAQVSDIITGSIDVITGTSKSLILECLAEKPDHALQSFIEDNASCNFNVVNVDWYENSPAVDICIERSMK